MDKHCVCSVEILGAWKLLVIEKKGKLEVVLGVTLNHELDKLGGEADGRRNKTRR